LLSLDIGRFWPTCNLGPAVVTSESCKVGVTTSVEESGSLAVASSLDDSGLKTPLPWPA